MSYTITLQCGCVVYVSCHPITQIAHTRVIESRASRCSVRRHEVGARIFVWELLPDKTREPDVTRSELTSTSEAPDMFRH
jgi:hypothetical protein